MIERQIEEHAAGRRRRGRRDHGGTRARRRSRASLTLRGELADAQLTFTDKHPEIVRLKEELATAEKARRRRARACRPPIGWPAYKPTPNTGSC